MENEEFQDAHEEIGEVPIGNGDDDGDDNDDVDNDRVNIDNEEFQDAHEEIVPIGNGDDDDNIILLAVANAAAAAVMLMEDEEDPEPEEEGERITVNINAWRNLGELDFHSHFRMSKELFEVLLQTVGNHLTNRGRIIRQRTPLHIALLGVLWILSTIDTFRSTCLKFNMTPGVLHFHYRYLIEALREMAPRFISWPSPQERVCIKRTFEERTGYPDCVGAIDGTHIYVTAPLFDKQTFVNRFFKYSIVAQAVVDCDLLVRDLYVGEPGSMHDSRVMMRSPFGSRLYHDPTMLSPGEHIIGDGAYMLTDKVQTPFRWTGEFDAVRRLFNRILSSTRMVVERLFGFVKGKFRRLKHFHSYSLDYAVDHIVSSFVLGNFILLNGVPYNEDIVQDVPADPAGPAEGLDRNGPVLRAARAAGRARRERMARLFSGLPVDD